MPAALGLRTPLLAARQSSARPAAQAKALRAAVRTQRLQRLTVRATEGEQKPAGDDEDRELSEQEVKQKEIDRLRAAEKFALIGSGKANCKGCGYVYDPSKGDAEYPISPGTKFEQLPEDWGCPTCGAPKNLFELDVKEVAGFAENQGYGFGTNSMTEETKSRLIYGSLLLFFFLFLSGYFLQ